MTWSSVSCKVKSYLILEQFILKLLFYSWLCKEQRFWMSLFLPNFFSWSSLKKTTSWNKNLPWVGKIPWRRKWQSTPVLLPGKSHGQRSLVAYSPWGCKQSDRTERLHFHFHLKCCIPTMIFPFIAGFFGAANFFFFGTGIRWWYYSTQSSLRNCFCLPKGVNGLFLLFYLRARSALKFSLES